MKRIAAILLPILLLFTSCDESAKKQQRSQPASTPTAHQAPASKPAGPWPPAAQDDIVLADNLLAANYYVVLDGSGSMNDNQCSGNQSKLETAKDALKEFAANVPADANLGLLVFTNSRIYELVPLGTGNRQQFAETVQSAPASGDTPLKEPSALVMLS